MSREKSKSALFDLASVSPLGVDRARWSRERGTTEWSDDGSTSRAFPFIASPTAAVFRPTGAAVGLARASASTASTMAVPKAVPVVESMNGTIRARAPRVTRDDDGDDDGDDDAPVVEDGSAALHEARVRRALDAAARGVDVGRMLAARGGGVARAADDATREREVTTTASEEATTNDSVEMGVVETMTTTPSLETVHVEEDEDAFERAVARALEAATRAPNTPVEKQPLERAVPRRAFDGKLKVKSPEKYATVERPRMDPAREALDFEAKLEAAMRAAEAGGDLSAILSGPSVKTARSPIGTASAESRVNYRELGFTKAEREHHRLHVAGSREA
ncbi:hypothetical protein BE221DRAFT_175048 [Ostreococcus tauri]|uniref:Uncharacterized protein n=1 Tax=Ostreococcus tauri TaxID=70448 RepID=A0A1Y5I230_OSTTA|nr:hypothetical protein BE221DRAFT_175048 [Ostreococcus tauri]